MLPGQARYAPSALSCQIAADDWRAAGWPDVNLNDNRMTI